MPPRWSGDAWSGPDLPDVGSVVTGTLGIVRLIRRALYALSLAGAIAGLLRVRGKGGVPPQEGGWREIKVSVPVDRPDR